MTPMTRTYRQCSAMSTALKSQVFRSRRLVSGTHGQSIAQAVTATAAVQEPSGRAGHVSDPK
jgi:hypothetical protein